MAQGRVFVIGDIHGCPDELDVLLGALAPRDEDTVVCLGDYIDRGPDPKGVVERLLLLEQSGCRCVFLKGNHEDMFLDFMGQQGHFGDAFLYNGGETTLESYGLAGLRGERLWAALPEEHRAFFRKLVLKFQWGTFLFVHAGLDPRRPLESQDEEDLLWIRHEWIQARHSFGVTVVFGHTPMRRPFLHWPYKIGIDTGLVYGNALTCLTIPDLSFIQVRREQRCVTAWEPPRDWLNGS
ncbi:MAG: serine/threonine protein phosphatase [Candidatus Binatia bacterium]|nr:serine/threonine protein phosphatase [Candidatus Binatia bacterium]